MVDFYNAQAPPFQMKVFEKIAERLQKLTLNSFANIATSAKAFIFDIHRKNLTHAPWNYDVERRLYDGALPNTCGVKGMNSDSLIRHHFKLDGSNLYVSFKPEENRFSPQKNLSKILILQDLIGYSKLTA